MESGFVGARSYDALAIARLESAVARAAAGMGNSRSESPRKETAWTTNGRTVAVSAAG
jgi:hypothetical protein